jgi:hypothetical protein
MLFQKIENPLTPTSHLYTEGKNAQNIFVFIAMISMDFLTTVYFIISRQSLDNKQWI